MLENWKSKTFVALCGVFGFVFCKHVAFSG